MTIKEISSVGNILVSAKDRYPDKIAITDAVYELTYEELYIKSIILSSYLIDNHSISSNSVVGFLVQNSVEFVLIHFAIQFSGAVSVPLDPEIKFNYLNQCAKIANIDVVIVKNIETFKQNKEAIQNEPIFKFVDFEKLEFGSNKYVLTEQKILFPKIEVEETPVFPLNLKVAEVLEAKRIPDADKLYVLQINLGKEKRQIVAGMVPHYSEEEIVGKHIVVVANLKKVKLRGFESKGMLLAASKDERVRLLECPASSPGAEVVVEGFQNNVNQISYDDFQKVNLDVKYKQVWFENKQLKTDKEDVSVDAADGSEVR